MGKAVSTHKKSDPVTKNKESTFSPTFFVSMALYLTLIVIAGFWPTYFQPLLYGEAPGHPKGLVESTLVIHIHGLVMLGWMGLLLFQATLIASGKTRKHMRIGEYGAIFGILVFLVGLLIVFMQVLNGVQQGIITWTQAPLFAWPSEIELLQFAILLYLGYRFRKKPTAHKRYMLFATMVLITAAINRMDYLLGPWSAEIMAAAMVVPIFSYDIYSERRIHQATYIGTGILSLFFIAKVFLE